MPNGPSRMRIISPAMMFFTSASSLLPGMGSQARRAICSSIAARGVARDGAAHLRGDGEVSSRFAGKLTVCRTSRV